MRAKILKEIRTITVSVIVSTMLIMGIRILSDGMYLFGVPDPAKVERVTICCPSINGRGKEVTDSAEIETAVNLFAFLKYAPFKSTAPGDEPLITLTYHLADGSDVTVSASRESVWWKGRVHALKQEGAFIKLTEGIFYWDDIVKKEEAS